MVLLEMGNITKCRESRFLSVTILDTHLAKVNLRKVFIESISLKLFVIFSFALISAKRANGLRSFLPNSGLCLTLDNNSFSKGFSSYYNCISFISSEKHHSTEFDAFRIYAAFLVTTVSSAIQTSSFS